MLDHAWDGEWFLRAYDFYGRPVGSATNEEGKIFIESQGFCAMAGIGLVQATPGCALWMAAVTPAGPISVAAEVQP